MVASTGLSEVQVLGGSFACTGSSALSGLPRPAWDRGLPAQVARTSWNRVGSPDLSSVISILYCNIVDPQCCSAVLHQPDLVKYIMVPIFSPLVYPQRILQCGEQSLLWYFIHPW